MNPPSPRTTPRRLMVPISRHFLPVLQPEPVAWLTTGLMKGSRRPFALDLLSGLTDCSLPFSDSLLAALPLPANAVSGDLASTIPDRMKGSLRPFALDLLSGLTDCSLPFSDSLLAALPLPANAVSGDLASTIPGFGCAWCRAAADVTFFVLPVFFIPAEPAVAVDFVADAALTVTGAAW